MTAQAQAGDVGMVKARTLKGRGAMTAAAF